MNITYPRIIGVREGVDCSPTHRCTVCNTIWITIPHGDYYLIEDAVIFQENTCGCFRSDDLYRTRLCTSEDIQDYQQIKRQLENV